MEQEIHQLLGKTVIKITGMEKGSDHIIFLCSDDTVFEMFHDQECCESVSIEDVIGDVEDLIGSEILKADELTNSEVHPEGYSPEYTPESFTWTFYNIATRNGHVTLRWLGESNGYYSESVTFKKTQ